MITANGYGVSHNVADTDTRWNTL